MNLLYRSLNFLFDFTKIIEAFRDSEDPEDIAWGVAGVTIGIVVDIASQGVSFGQGTVGGAAAGMTARRILRKKLLRRKCLSQSQFFADTNVDLSNSFYNLAEKIKRIRGLSFKEAVSEYNKINNSQD